MFAKAIPEEKDETGAKELWSHEEQGLSTNNDSEEETSDLFHCCRKHGQDI